MLLFNTSIIVEEIIYSYLCEKLPFSNDLNPDDKFLGAAIFWDWKNDFISKPLYSVHHYWGFNICWIYEFMKIALPLANEILFFFIYFFIQVVYVVPQAQCYIDCVTGYAVL